jgi:non-haem Fe2+, alpha-ketoglutarate-dependent halogenase
MTDLNIIKDPTEEELSQVARDLNFEKTRNDSPQALSLSQINQYNEQGYLMPFDGLPAAEIEEVRKFFDPILAQALTEGKNSYSISTAHLKFGRIYDLMHHSAIIAPVKDLLGKDLVAWGAHFFCKMPNDGKRVPWHQDCPYWPLTPTRTATVWLAIDDASPENANMRFIPGSHLDGVIDYEMSDSPDDILKREVKNVGKFGEPVDVSLKAGQFSIHSDLLLHGSDANLSSKRRCGLTMRYASAEVKAYLGWEQKGVLVSGKNERGHWVNLPRPQNS